MTFLTLANFKSHQTLSDLTTWLNEVQLTPQTVIAPNFLHLSYAASRVPNALCAQDVSPFPPGSYTGATSAQQLKELGVKYSLVGHSERRRYFHESSNDVSRKVSELISCGITPIICQRQEDIASDRAAFDNFDPAKAYFCFEPSSDIGGQTTAPVEQIREITQQISQVFSTPLVMYGGSVNAENISSLLPLNLAGVLVSTASLDPSHFNRLLTLIPHE